MLQKTLMGYWISKFMASKPNNPYYVKNRMACYHALIDFIYVYKGSPLILPCAPHPDFKSFLGAISIGMVACRYKIFK